MQRGGCQSLRSNWGGAQWKAGLQRYWSFKFGSSFSPKRPQFEPGALDPLAMKCDFFESLHVV